MVKYNNLENPKSLATAANLAFDAYHEAVDQARAEGNDELADALWEIFEEVASANVKALDAICDLQ